MDVKKYVDEYDPNLEINYVNDAIIVGARGIAIRVFAPVINLCPAIAKAAGVVLLGTDTSINVANGKLLPIIRFDGKEMGKKVGETASKLLAESGCPKDSTMKVGLLSLEVIANRPAIHVLPTKRL